MNTTLEQQRVLLAEIERAVSRNVFELQHKQRTVSFQLTVCFYM